MIADEWASALSSPSAFAAAWRILRRTVTRHAVRRPGADSPVHRLLTVPLADAVLLHHGLGMPLPDVAELTGTAVADVRALMSGADRALGRPLQE
ncbi:hypothetical protein [Streptomyces uncialis]|uniref:hypothetical protein n=1 Tax=Streptomyces uncialis TaxID=1048205 RepID=UPI00225A34DB|nr:hypothetical protein [Streptomyces uncialis]MCX4659140.1 hypothetical protein [Streptomyces uncialis]